LLGADQPSKYIVTASICASNIGIAISRGTQGAARTINRYKITQREAIQNNKKYRGQK
jgi:plastocyanin domain-containing protein